MKRILLPAAALLTMALLLAGCTMDGDSITVTAEYLPECSWKPLQLELPPVFQEPASEGLEPFETDAPSDITALYPRFSGTVRYETEACLPASWGIALPGVYGAVRLWVDGREAGARTAPPYHFPVETAAGIHQIAIEITNAPVFRWRDALSSHAWLPPTGLTGPIALLRAVKKGD